MTRKPSGNICIRDGNYQGKRLYASLAEIRAVWAIITEQPSISVRRIRDEFGMGKERAWHIVRFLKEAGYIEQVPGCTGRKIVIPFGFTEEKGTALKRKPTKEILTEQPY